jgi:catechol 2,3-dioxygenase-like lactoylglutathione lyase family enzyme
VSEFKPKHVAVVCIRVTDLLDAARFYRDIVGLVPIEHHPHRPAFSLGTDTYLVLDGSKPCLQPLPDSPDFPDIAFAVENLNQAIDHLKAANALLPWPMKSDRESQWIIFPDPSGNLVEFVQFAPGLSALSAEAAE